MSYDPLDLYKFPPCSGAIGHIPNAQPLPQTVEQRLAALETEDTVLRNTVCHIWEDIKTIATKVAEMNNTLNALVKPEGK